MSAVILPLIGVLLGTLGTLTGQFLATRGDSRRHAAERSAAARAERKEAIVRFLAAAQRVEQVIDNVRHRGTPTDPAVDGLLNDVWLAKKLIELVCGNDVSAAAHRYTGTLEDLARNAGAPDDLAARQRDTRAVFMEAARTELGVAGPPLYRLP